jgi:predicted DNA-binding helix-hairpin-helix protein
MENLFKLRALSSQMELEPAEDAGCPKIAESGDLAGMVSHAVIPGGKQISLLKTLLTSACERNCYYCPFRAGRNFHRATLKPLEMAHSFINLHRAGIVEGLFLSSGIINGGVSTQDKLIDTAEILRNKLQYRGYLHLKIMPGAEKDQVMRSMQLADRVSVNLEAPNPTRILELAPLKDFEAELLQPIRWINEIRQTQSGKHSWNSRWPSSVTQFVVGGSGETDLELLSTTVVLYRQFNLRRAYFSAFHPIEDTPLESLPATPKIREHRLYQASFLLRDYGFSVEDLPFEAGGQLPSETDPKLAWAQSHLAHQPVEINRASREELLRIPGVGPRTAGAILSARQGRRINQTEQLKQFGIPLPKAAPFILLDGRQPEHQLPLFKG